jgi:hypothetical protein
MFLFRYSLYFFDNHLTYQNIDDTICGKIRLVNIDYARYFMKRKTFFLFGYLLSIMIFIIFYSYFWYTLGKFPIMFNDISTAIVMMIYFLILILVAKYQYQSPYHETNKSLVSIFMYAIPLFLVITFILSSGDFNSIFIEENQFALFFSGVFGINLLNYVISIFAKE